MVRLNRLLEILLLTSTVLGHPGGHDEGNMSLKERRVFRQHARRSLNSCSQTAAHDQTLRRAAAQRAELFKKHSKRHVWGRRDTPTMLATDHSVNLNQSILQSPEKLDASLFESPNAAIVMPEGEIGPFWVRGEHIRSDIVDDEKGIPVYLHAQLIDVNTCSPIPDLYLDVWNANSSGVYRYLLILQPLANLLIERQEPNTSEQWCTVPN